MVYTKIFQRFKGYHREGRGAMVSAELSADVAACRAVRIPLGAEFSEKYHVFPLSILEYCFDVVLLGKALHPQMIHLTQVNMSTW